MAGAGQPVNAEQCEVRTGDRGQARAASGQASSTRYGQTRTANGAPAWRPSREQTRAASGGQAYRPSREQTRTTSCQTDWEARSQAWNKEGNEAGGETDCKSSGEACYSRQRTGGRGKRSETGPP